MENSKTTSLVSENLAILFDCMKQQEQKYGFIPSLFAETSMQDPCYYEKQKIQEQIKKAILTKTISLFGYNKLPEIVSDEKYKKLSGINFINHNIRIKDQELYRGVRDINHHANTLCDKDYHIGIGDVCNGIYVTGHYGTAYTYTNCTSEELIMRLKIPEMNIIDNVSLVCDVQNIFNGITPYIDAHKDALTDIKNFIQSIKSDEDRSKFAYTFFCDLAISAIFLGYDAVYDINFPSYAIFNRGKICVSESEFNRICKLANREQFMQPQKQ